MKKQSMKLILCIYGAHFPNDLIKTERAERKTKKGKEISTLIGANLKEVFKDSHIVFLPSLHCASISALVFSLFQEL